ncbi:MAG: calcium/sodium antiporter [Firmicutes bacterium]|nr:calcium/sodium antiporter [Bacillota bacterium]
MYINVIWALLGMALLVKGADWFVKGASDIAKALKISPLVIGLTLVSMGTSAPEASVSINSAINGMSDMSVGNIVGSNIFNTLFILGISALLVPLAVSKSIRKYDIPVMVGVYGILFLFGLVKTPFTLDRLEGIMMVLLFVGYTITLIWREKREKAEQMIPAEQAKGHKRVKLWSSILIGLVGIIGVILGGDVVVEHAAKIAESLGMSQALVGLTIVAVGTSLPELVTSMVACIKKENDIAVGNVIGSNIFNVLFILGASATIDPLTLAKPMITDMWVMAGSGILMLILTRFSQKIGRWQGIAMIMMYGAYMAYIIARN